MFCHKEVKTEEADLFNSITQCIHPYAKTYTVPPKYIFLSFKKINLNKATPKNIYIHPMTCM